MSLRVRLSMELILIVIWVFYRVVEIDLEKGVMFRITKYTKGFKDEKCIP